MIPMHAHQDALRLFLERGLGIEIGPAQFMGWARPDGIVASVGFNNWQPDAGVIEMHAYASRRDWLSKDRLRELFSYPFGQLGVRMCVARISERNDTARRVWRALGASEFVIPELRGPGEAEAIYTLHRDQWSSGKFMR
ncbi:hypothetical protein [Paracoccus sp. AS002]|uniref:hypothetical protein n=1 Tax=Paracoccus sp. AS002 TaxID=3019545 RepID=UPI0023E8EEA1|nr:hypothetical protein [Paracoccus sp. AS002]MDF3904697.1 hypothetical protein [Paracoccus sp. AS002]